jgi:tetratricopeptide (TPR) repeat protein
VVESFVRDAGDPSTRLERLGWAAHLLEETCVQAGLSHAAKELLSAEAEAAYRDWAAADSAAGLQLTQFIARHGQIALALELFEQAAQRSDSQAISSTADILTGNHPLSVPQLSRIRKVLERAAELRTAAVLMVSQANLATLAGDYRQAESLYRQALDIEPRQVTALEKLALVRSLSDGQHAEALRLIEQAIEIAGPEAQLLDSRATVELAAGQWRAAQGDLKDALGDQPSASSYFHLAQLLAAEGNAKGAKTALSQGHELGLNVNGLHPLEQRTYKQLASQLEGGSRNGESR